MRVGRRRFVGERFAPARRSCRRGDASRASIRDALQPERPLSRSSATCSETSVRTFLRTDDYGTTWRSIAGDLPADQFVRTIRQDPRNADVLYAGTNRGVWVTFDGGSHWQSLRLEHARDGGLRSRRSSRRQRSRRRVARARRLDSRRPDADAAVELRAKSSRA